MDVDEFLELVTKKQLEDFVPPCCALCIKEEKLNNYYNNHKCIYNNQITDAVRSFHRLDSCIYNEYTPKENSMDNGEMVTIVVNTGDEPIEIASKIRTAKKANGERAFDRYQLEEITAYLVTYTNHDGYGE